MLQAAAVNSTAPSFSLPNSQHQKRALSDYRGKVVFINFWASWCGPCRFELPELNRLAVAFSDKNVKVVAINVDRDRSLATKLFHRLGLRGSHLEILWDSQSKVVSAFKIEGMPSSFILDDRGVIRFVHAGFHRPDLESWRKEIKSLLLEKKHP